MLLLNLCRKTNRQRNTLYTEMTVSRLQERIFHRGRIIRGLKHFSDRGDF